MPVPGVVQPRSLLPQLWARLKSTRSSRALRGRFSGWPTHLYGSESPEVIGQRLGGMASYAQIRFLLLL